MKFGVREICDVVFKAKQSGKLGNYKYTPGQPVLYIDSAKASAIEGAATTVYATGGKGNSRLIAWEGEKTLTFTVEDALLSDRGFAILSGADLFKRKADSNQNNIPVHRNLEKTISIEVKDSHNLFKTYLLLNKTITGLTSQSTVNNLYFNRVNSTIINTGIYLSDLIAEWVKNTDYYLSYESENVDMGFMMNDMYYSMPIGSSLLGADPCWNYPLVFRIADGETTGTVKNICVTLGTNPQELPYMPYGKAGISEIIIDKKDELRELDLTAPCFIMLLDADGSIVGKGLAGFKGTIGTDGYVTNLKADNLTYLNNNPLADFSTGTHDCTVFIDYYTSKKPAISELIIDAGNFGGYYYVEAATKFRRQVDGKDLDAIITLPNVKIQSNFTFSMAPTGDPSTFTFTMDAMPGYTINNPTKKVLCEMHIIDEEIANNKEITDNDSIEEIPIIDNNDWSVVGAEGESVEGRIYRGSDPQVYGTITIFDPTFNNSITLLPKEDGFFIILDSAYKGDIFTHTNDGTYFNIGAEITKYGEYFGVITASTIICNSDSSGTVILESKAR